MVDVGKLPDVPGLKKSSVLETLRTQGFGNKDALTIDEKFFQAVLDWLETWINIHASSDTNKDAPAIFVFDPDPAVGPSIGGATRAPGFAQSFPRAIGGNVHCCNFNLRAVWRNKVDCKDGPDALAYLEKAGLVSQAAVVFLGEQYSALIHRPNESVEDCERLRLTSNVGKKFVFLDIDEHLKTFHT